MNITEERFIFTPALKKRLGIIAAVGLVIAIIGVISMVFFGHGDTHATGEVAAATEDHGLHWSTRIWASLWINNIFFVGLSIVGVFFFALQYVAQAGWSAGIQRINLAFGYWLPIGAILMLIVFVVANHNLFHWT
ncbi:MAG: quinol:cytochrome C oxidoreductase, partial [Bacteroidota bacterium]|nr:quinol:cytochrome C oxidoreductase [Bacteroidota bacterium]MDQ3536241.1 quinol:cytochrome C oxidoreductase [Bacteroidota bacterium]